MVNGCWQGCDGSHVESSLVLPLHPLLFCWCHLSKRGVIGFCQNRCLSGCCGLMCVMPSDWHDKQGIGWDSVAGWWHDGVWSVKTQQLLHPTFWAFGCGSKHHPVSWLDGIWSPSSQWLTAWAVDCFGVSHFVSLALSWLHAPFIWEGEVHWLLGNLQDQHEFAC